MLTEQAIDEILDSDKVLTEFVTASMIQAIAIGVDRIKRPECSPSVMANLIDALRKARADLTGEKALENKDLPTMMVNIAFSNNDTNQPRVLNAPSTEVHDPAASIMVDPQPTPSTPNIWGDDD